MCKDLLQKELSRVFLVENNYYEMFHIFFLRFAPGASVGRTWYTYKVLSSVEPKKYTFFFVGLSNPRYIKNWMNMQHKLSKDLLQNITNHNHNLLNNSCHCMITMSWIYNISHPFCFILSTLHIPKKFYSKLCQNNILSSYTIFGTSSLTFQHEEIHC